MEQPPKSSLLSSMRINEYIRLASLGVAALLVLKIAASEATPRSYASAPPPSPLVWPLALVGIGGLGYLGFRIFRAAQAPDSDGIWLPWRAVNVLQELLISVFGAAMFSVLPIMLVTLPDELREEYGKPGQALFFGFFFGLVGFVLLAFRPGVLVDTARGKVTKHRFARFIPWTREFSLSDLKIWTSWRRLPYAPAQVAGIEIDPNVYYLYAKVDRPGGGDFMVERVQLPRSPAEVKRLEDAWRAVLGQAATDGDAPTRGDFGTKKKPGA